MKPHLFLAVLLAISLPAWASSTNRQTPAGSDSTTVVRAHKPAPGLGRVAANCRHWYQPRQLVLQTGGGVGLVSAGVSLSFARDHLALDALVGYVPPKYAGSALSIASAKAKYSPWTLPLSSRLALTPLSVGIYVSYTHGLRNAGQPGQYPNDYYWFSNTVRVGPVVGSALSYALAPSATGRRRRITAYYELGTNDLYLISYVQNRRALSLPDIATLALGLKLDL